MINCLDGLLLVEIGWGKGVLVIAPCGHLLFLALDAFGIDLGGRESWVKREAWRGREAGESPC